MAALNGSYHSRDPACVQVFEGFATGTSLLATAQLQSPALLYINERAPALYAFCLTCVAPSPLSSLHKGLGVVKQDFELFKQQVHNHDSYILRRCIVGISSVLARCDEEGFLALVRLLRAVLDQYQQPNWDSFETCRYYRYAGEVEVRNADRRTLGFRHSVLAEESEDVAHEVQLMAMTSCIPNLTPSEWKTYIGKLPFC